MRLDAVAVKNFRGYTDEQEIQVADLTTIVGRNDVGKSTILEALAIFFGHELVKPDVGDLNVKTEATYFEITCTFSALPATLILDKQAETSLAREHLLTADGRLKIRKRWDCSGAKPKEEVVVVCEHPRAEGLSDLLLLTNAALKARLNGLLSTEDAAVVNKSSNPAMRHALWDSTSELQAEETEVPVSKEDSKRIWENLSPLLPHFALFQSDRASRDSDNEVQDPMKLAISTALAEPEVTKALADVVEAVRERATELATRTHTALTELDSDLAEGLVPMFKSDPRWASLFSVALEGTDGIAINKRGSGVRRLVLVSFFKAEAERKMTEGSKSSVIYAIEEPETSQHPRNQKVLLESFEQMARSEGCQVLLTTHSPGVASHLPADSLRFVSKTSSGPRIESAGVPAWDAIADELGILPDDRVRVLICVEGPHDVAALRALSGALNKVDSTNVDLATDARFAFVPLGGGTLKQWVASRYLKGFGRPEFHLYDRDVASYAEAVEEINARADGSTARLTKRLEMENYIHPDVVKALFDVEITISADADVPKLIASALGADSSKVSLSAGRVKAKLAEAGFPQMTKSHLDAMGLTSEVTTWLTEMKQMAEK